MFARIVSALPLKYRPFAKAIIPPLGILVGVVASAVKTHNVNTSEILTAGIAVLTAFATYKTPNFDPTGRLTPDQPA